MAQYKKTIAQKRSGTRKLDRLLSSDMDNKVSNNHEQET